MEVLFGRPLDLEEIWAVTQENMATEKGKGLIEMDRRPKAVQDALASFH